MSESLKIAGMVATFESPGALLEAAEKVRNGGYTKFDCHSPFPIHGMDRAMGMKRSPLGWIVGVAALLVFGGVIAGIYWVVVDAYPMVISGKPFFSYQAFTPVVFALTVLGSAITATFGMMVLNRLPQLYHPLFESEKFCKFSDDGFIVSISSADPKFDTVKTKSFLQSIGSSHAEVVEIK